MEAGLKSLKIYFLVCILTQTLLTKLNTFCYLGQTAVDRPDLVAHVFHAKQQALLKNICDGYFGEVDGFVYTIKYQKCGFPHVHLLIFLEQQDKISTVQQMMP
jgi:hypothetical protein